MQVLFPRMERRMIRDFLKRLLSIAFSLLMVIPAAQWEAVAQQPAPVTQQPAPAAPTPAESAVLVAPLSAEQLQQLVAPIALFPDVLIAQILGAASFPEQVRCGRLPASAEQKTYWQPSDAGS
jgi:hypothetical protein